MLELWFEYMANTVNISISPDLMSRVDQALAQVHVGASTPHTRSRSALIAHVLSRWLLEVSTNESASPLALSALDLAPMALEVPAPAPEPRSLREAIVAELDRRETLPLPWPWTHIDVMRARMSIEFPFLTFRELKDTLTVMADDGVIVAELQRMPKDPFPGQRTGWHYRPAPVEG